MGAAVNGTWSNHSGFLARAIADELPAAVRVVPERTFFPWPCSPEGLDAMLTRPSADGVDGALTLHLCAHLWWHPARTDFCTAHAGLLTVDHVRSVDTPYNLFARPYLPEVDLW